MKLRSLAPYALLAMAAVLVDQWIKYLVETGLPLQQGVELLPFLALSLELFRLRLLFFCSPLLMPGRSLIPVWIIERGRGGSFRMRLIPEVLEDRLRDLGFEESD